MSQPNSRWPPCKILCTLKAALDENDVFQNIQNSNQSISLHSSAVAKITNLVAISAVYVKLVITQSRQSIVLVDLDVGVFASCVECTRKEPRINFAGEIKLTQDY